MSTDTHLITAEQFAEMHFDAPVELVRGEIVYLYGEDGVTRPDQVHGGVCGNVYSALRSWARQLRLGFATTNDAGIRTQHDPDSVRGADVAYFPIERLPGGKLPRGLTEIIPQICVEVLSPSNSRSEMASKRNEFLACGVEEVWIIDPELRIVEVFRQDAPLRRFNQYESLTSLALPEFTVPVSDLFEGI